MTSLSSLSTNFITKNKIRHFLRSFVILLMFLSGGYLSAQTPLSLPHFDGFENPSSNATWNLVNGTSINKWYIGNAEFAAGSRGLYVSGYKGNNTNYVNSATGIAAWKEYYLPGTSNWYQISFNWKVGGEAATNGTALDSLFVFWVTNTSVQINTSAGEMPNALKSYKKELVDTKPIQGKDFWHHSTIRVRGGNVPGRLVFYWINNDNNSNPPAACIDNIQIGEEGSLCEQPTILSVTQDGGIKITWEGNADAYQLKYKNETTGVWGEITPDIQNKHYTVTGLDKGFYTFWLRGICGTDTTAWTIYSNHLLAVSMDKCINYADLKNTNVVTGKFGGYGGRGRMPYTGINDFGYNNPRSQHTVHYRQDEYDAFSYNNIKTVPRGEVASVRLGTYIGDGGAESLTYTFTVDNANPILLIKYAAVMENLNHTGSDSEAQPRFILRVTDTRDIPLDETGCTSISFLAGNLPGWNNIPGDNATHFPIIWKDWTTMGIDLSAHIGKQVKFYMETGDCYGSAFPDQACRAYAYFTLDCVTNKLEGLTCGSAVQSTDTLWAPPGFSYRWYKASDPNNVLYDTRYFIAQPGDTATYKCDVNFLEPGKEHCGFTLLAPLLPRYPAADFEYFTCRREVQLFDKSYVYTQNGKTNEQCDIYWDLGDSISYERNPVHEFAAPGEYTVTLYASLDDGQCDSIWSQVITVSDDTIKTYDSAAICYKKRYTFGERELTESGVYADTLKTYYGCDSISILELEVLRPIARDTICNGQTYEFEEELLTLNEGTHELTYKNIKSVTGCDSILHLYVASAVQAEYESEICADENFMLFRLTAGGAEKVTFQFDPTSSLAGFKDTTVSIASNKTFKLTIPENVYAGICSGKFIFDSSFCGTSESTFSFTITYPGTIIAQRWNDVLGVLNKDNNIGGYEFTAFQWYRNGEKLEGETKSYLFVESGLNPNDVYYVELTRLSDGLTLVSCGFSPTEKTGGLILASNMVKSLEKIILRSNEEGVAHIYSMTGLLIGEYKLIQGENQLPAPLHPGYYLLKLKTEQNDKTYHLHITK